jgi:CheY-like chemotaxis protein
VAVTASTEREDRKRVLREGFQAHVAKPVDLSGFLGMVRTILGSEAAAALHPGPGANACGSRPHSA